MKVYLAGPDVFRPDAAAWMESARILCRRLGHEPLTPLDHDESEPARICRANLDLIRQAEAVVANLDPFRGAEPDSGTCFELGYAHALGKRVCGYVARLESLRDRVRRCAGADPERAVDSRGMAIENFGLPLNLMLAVPALIVAGGLEECLRALAGAAAEPERPSPGISGDPGARLAQEAAIRYLRWVADGRIADADPVATVADRYAVRRETVLDWIAAWSAISTASAAEYRPDDILRQMRIGGRQYRRLS